MRHKVLAKSVSLALLASLAQTQTAFALTDANGGKFVRPVFDHNFNKTLYGNKPIVTPHVHAEPTRVKRNIDDNRYGVDDEHLTFKGHDDAPVVMEKAGDIRYDVQGEKSSDAVRDQIESQRTEKHMEQGDHGEHHGAADAAKESASAKDTAALQQFNSVIKSSWSTWTAHSDGRLSMQGIASLLLDTKLPADQINALSALATQVQTMTAAAYNNHQLQPGIMMLMQGKDGNIVLRDGSKGTGKRLNLSSTAQSYTSKLDEEQGCNAALNVELLQYWGSWTASTNGVMTFAQFSQLSKQTQPPITGSEAAALGSIGNQMNDLQYSAYNATPKGQTTAMLTLKMQVSADGQVTLVNGSGQQESTASYAWNYYAPGARMLGQDVAGQGKNVRNKLDKLSLYGPGDAIQVNDVRQGDYNDCFFLSCVWSCMHSFGTSYVQNMIKQVGTDSFQVSFPGYAHNPINVTITPTEAAMFSRTTNGGCYLSVLALAADQIASSTTTGKSAETKDQLTPLYAIVNCGFDRPFLQLLTGQTYNQIATPTLPSKQTSFQSELIKAFNSGQPVNVSTRDHYMTVDAISTASTPTGLVNYVGPAGAAGPFVTIHNQWGNTGWYTAPDGTKVKMENGYYTIPMSDMYSYGLIGIQVSAGPAKVTSPLVASAPQVGSSDRSIASPRVAEDVRIGHSRKVDESLRLDDGSSKTVHKAQVTSSSDGAATPTRSRMKGMGDTKNENGGGNTGPISTPGVSAAADGAKQFDMVNGTAFIAHADPVQVNIPGGAVKIASGAAVYISKHGNACAVFNLTNTSHGGVVVSAGGKDRTVSVGQALITCEDQDGEFEAINPCKAVINSSRATLLEKSSAARTFAATYSPIAVLDNSAQFAQLVRSKDAADRALADRILKTAAALSQMTPQQ